jgi:signal transduction histidine kinase
VQAQALSKLLLADVREVVSTLREGDPIDVDHALQKLVADVPRPEIHLELPSPFRINDRQRAQVLVRLVQEIVTNTVKHAQAKNLWLKFARTDDGVEISAFDDGRGVDVRQIGSGNGLKGMRERLEAVGGELLIESKSGQGFNLAGFLPLKSEAHLQLEAHA